MSSYCASSDLTDWIDFTTDATVDSALLGDIITRASGIINDYCGRVFDAPAALDSDGGSSDHSTDGVLTNLATRYFDPIADVSRMTLFLDKDLASIGVVTNGDAAVVTTDEYVLLPTNESPYYAIKLKRSAGKVWTYTSDPEQSVTVTGWWSYALTVPAAITHACMRLSQWIYKQRSSDAVSDQPIVLASGLTIMPAKLPADVLSMLEPYRRIWIGAA